MDFFQYLDQQAKQSSQQEGENEAIFLFLVAVLCIAGIIAYILQPVQNYRGKFKQNLFPKVLQLFGDFSYQAYSRVDDRIIEKMPQQFNYAESYGSDLIQGRINKVNFQFSQLRLESGSDSDSSLFNGYIIALSNETFAFPATLVYYNQPRHMEQLSAKHFALKRIKIPYNKFEDLFDAYGDDQVAARELLDPVMIENLVKLNKSFGGRKFSVYFKDTLLVILIHTKKPFFKPPPIWKPIRALSDFQDVKDEVHRLTKVAQTLELHRKQD